MLNRHYLPCPPDAVDTWDYLTAAFVAGVVWHVVCSRRWGSLLLRRGAGVDGSFSVGWCSAVVAIGWFPGRLVRVCAKQCTCLETYMFCQVGVRSCC